MRCSQARIWYKNRHKGASPTSTYVAAKLYVEDRMQAGEITPDMLVTNLPPITRETK
jgi:hypothetical protein